MKLILRFLKNVRVLLLAFFLGQEKKIEGKWVNNFPDTYLRFMLKSFENFSFSFCSEVDPEKICLRNLREILCHFHLTEMFNDFKKEFSNYLE